jgi:hypothetical protein
VKKKRKDTNIEVKVEETNDECKIVIINKFYNEWYKKFLCYYWLVTNITKQPKISKRLRFCKFPQTCLNCGFRFTPTTCIITRYEKLIKAYFSNLYDLIFKTFKTLEHAFDTYLKLIKFLWSWSNFWKTQGITLLGARREYLAHRRLGARGCNQP